MSLPISCCCYSDCLAVFLKSANFVSYPFFNTTILSGSAMNHAYVFKASTGIRLRLGRPAGLQKR
ncbi:hypothetical protein JOC69_000652 [Heliobacterium gestii]|nr:hypothetical protein [Heliomicrobium gestii]